MLIIDESTPADVIFPKDCGRGLVPRDFNEFPAEAFAPPADLPLIPRSEWSDRIKEQKERGARISDIRRRAANGSVMPNLDQGRSNYCWTHSVTHMVMLARAINNQPYIPLSAFSLAVPIKNGRNEGGWCGLAHDRASKIGIASQKAWPQGDFNTSRWNAEVAADAARHRVTEDWVDLTRDVWGRNLTFDQIATCLLSGIPCSLDFAWWSHSVCGMDLVEVEPGSFGILILNSWANWGDQGEGVLRGSRAIPMSAVAARVVTAAA